MDAGQCRPKSVIHCAHTGLYLREWRPREVKAPTRITELRRAGSSLQIPCPFSSLPIWSWLPGWFSCPHLWALQGWSKSPSPLEPRPVPTITWFTDDQAGLPAKGEGSLTSHWDHMPPPLVTWWVLSHLHPSLEGEEEAGTFRIYSRQG